MSIELPIFVIYERPSDIPHAAYVVRAWKVTLDGFVLTTVPNGVHLAANPTMLSPEMQHTEHASLEEARSSIPNRCYRVDRLPEEDPAIVEKWI